MSGIGNKLSAQCCAKTNLYLHITGKRPDSFHDIETVFWPVTKVKDHLQIDFAPGKGSDPVTIFCETAGVPLDSSNLCWKAAEKYFAAAGISPRPILIHLEKGIPISAGMGGGSSDCASVLLLMEEYFGALGKDRLAALALSLGSDVPFFLEPSPAVGRGRGEKLERIAVKDLSLPLLFASPDFPVSAAWAYSHLDYSLCRESSPALSACRKALEEGDLPLLRESLRNDLAPAIFHKYPLAAILHEALEGSGAAPLLSGSGPTLFALYRDDRAMEKGKEMMEKRFSGEGITFF